MQNSNVFGDIGISIDILKSENFLKIKETLTRIGIATDDKVLYQSCHILHKKDLNNNSHYAIVHFKEMFKLDGKKCSLDQKDIERRNKIASLLQEWNMIKINEELDSLASMTNIKIIPFKEKDNWTLVAKYNIGVTKNE